jgi:hypothetical protein
MDSDVLENHHSTNWQDQKYLHFLISYGNSNEAQFKVKEPLADQDL